MVAVRGGDYIMRMTILISLALLTVSFGGCQAQQTAPRPPVEDAYDADSLSVYRVALRESHLFATPPPLVIRQTTTDTYLANYARTKSVYEKDLGRFGTL
jgi:hypothetical protein